MKLLFQVIFIHKIYFHIYYLMILRLTVNHLTNYLTSEFVLTKIMNHLFNGKRLEWSDNILKMNNAKFLRAESDANIRCGRQGKRYG